MTDTRTREAWTRCDACDAGWVGPETVCPTCGEPIPDTDPHAALERIVNRAGARIPIETGSIHRAIAQRDSILARCEALEKSSSDLASFGWRTQAERDEARADNAALAETLEDVADGLEAMESPEESGRIEYLLGRARAALAAHTQRGEKS